MKTIVIGVMCALAMACTNEQNVGNTYTLHSARWAVPLVGLDAAGSVATYGVVLDPTGDVLADGAFWGTVDFGGGPVTSSTTSGPTWWLGKRSGVDGSFLWTVVLGGQPMSNFTLGGLRVDSDGDAIIFGSFMGTEPLGDQTISSPGGRESFYVAKVSPDGHIVWARALWSLLDANPIAMGVGADGRIYITGQFQGSISFPNGPITGTGQQAYFLAALEPDGTVRWGQQIPVPGRIEVASDGSVVLVGAVAQSTTFAGVSIDLAQDPARVAADITPDGHVAWVRLFGKSGVAYEHVLLALDAHDQIATTSTIGDPGLTSGTDESLLAADGGALWSASPASGHTSESAIATNGHAVLTAGRLNDWTVDLGDGPQVGSMYIAARDVAGQLVDTKVFGDPGSIADIAGLAMAQDGAVAFTASITEPVDFGTGKIAVPAGQDDASVIGLFAPPP